MYKKQCVKYYTYLYAKALFKKKSYHEIDGADAIFFSQDEDYIGHYVEFHQLFEFNKVLKF